MIMPSEALRNIQKLIDSEIINGNIKNIGGAIDNIKAHELQLTLVALGYLERIS